MCVRFDKLEEKGASSLLFASQVRPSSPPSEEPSPKSMVALATSELACGPEPSMSRMRCCEPFAV